MTRTAQIYNFANSQVDCEFFNEDLYEGIITGAKWADKTMIDKACEWLNSVDMRMYVIADHTSSNINRFAMNKFISDFCKAMEE